MKTTIKSCYYAIIAIALCAFSIYLFNDSNKSLSFMVMDNIEALSQSPEDAETFVKGEAKAIGPQCTITDPVTQQYRYGKRVVCEWTGEGSCWNGACGIDNRPNK